LVELAESYDHRTRFANRINHYLRLLYVARQDNHLSHERFSPFVLQIFCMLVLGL
jgi:hypothetical protein